MWLIFFVQFVFEPFLGVSTHVALGVLVNVGVAMAMAVRVPLLWLLYFFLNDVDKADLRVVVFFIIPLFGSLLTFDNFAFDLTTFKLDAIDAFQFVD